MRRHMIKKLAWETDYDLSDLELLKDAELEKMYYEKVPGAQERVDSLLGLAHNAMKPHTLKSTMESIEKETKSWEDYGMPTAEEEPKKKPERRLHSWFQHWEEQEKEKEKAKEPVKEFAPDDSGDGGEEDNLHKYARMWYNGDLETQQQVEQILDRMGWEIGELESEEGGAFVVQSGDENGNSYIGFSAEDLTEAVKQRLDAKCWTGKHKEGTKIKGGVRVNNCVPNEAANPAQQAAIAIAKKKKKELNEAPIELDPSEPTNPMIYGHEKANPAKLDYRMLRAAGQFKDLASRVRTAQEVGDIRLWSSIIADFKELSMNVGQISHALEELEKTRRKGGVNSRGIPDLS
jgi:hypothetical protein